MNYVILQIKKSPSLEDSLFSSRLLAGKNYTVKAKIKAILFSDMLHSFVLVAVQSLSRVRLFGTPWTAAWQASLSFTISQSLLKLMYTELAMASNHFVFCHHLLFLPSIFPSIRVFSNVSVICLKWPKCWRFSFSISPSDEYSGLISFRIDRFDLLAVPGTLKSLLQHHSQKHQFFGTQLSLWSNSHIHSWLLEKP